MQKAQRFHRECVRSSFAEVTERIEEDLIKLVSHRAEPLILLRNCYVLFVTDHYSDIDRANRPSKALWLLKFDMLLS